jgi:hypothetical protein
MRKLTATLTLLFLCCFIHGCANISSTTINKNARLKERIFQAYEYQKEKNDKFLNYFVNSKSWDNNIRMEGRGLLRGSHPLSRYSIKRLEIDGDNAKVKMEVTLQIKDKNNSEQKLDTFEQCDYWIFIDNDWYVNEFNSPKE